MKNFLAPLLALAVLLPFSGWAETDPLNGSYTAGNSIAGSYDARSIFTNPASLSYNLLLNGPGLNSSFTWAVNENREDGGSIGISLNAFGFGYERLSFGGTQRLSRYHFAGALPLGPNLFLGSRLTLNRSDTLPEYTGLSLGLQYRPHPLVSVGIVANDLNQPDLAPGVEAPTRWVAGVLLRPLSWLDLSVDVDTLSGNGNRFGADWGYQAHGTVSVAPGVRVTGGYHSLYEFQVGLRVDLGQGTVHSTMQPSSASHHLILGMHSSVRPKPSVVVPESTIKITVNGTLQAEPREATLLSPSLPHLKQLLERLDWAAERDSVAEVKIHLKEFPLGWAEAQEVHRAIAGLRKRGKNVEVFLGNCDLKDYYIATAASQIFIEQGSQMDLTGLKFSRHFFKGTLDKLGVEAEIFARGKYKSAPEAFTRKGSSPTVREADLAALRDVENRIVKELEKTGRIRGAQQWARVLNMGLYTPSSAIEEKLVDGIDSFDSDEDESVRLPEGPPYRRDLSLPPRIAVIHAVGPIMSTKGGIGLSGGGVITAEGMKKKFDQAVKDPRTRAIVLRVNSGGGEIRPSYKIGRMVEQAKLVKPIVVSMGGAAASGGYLISAPAHRIVAEPYTMTGSIGVFVGKPNLKGLYEKIDLNKEILSFAPHADLYSWDRPFDPEGRRVMTRLLDNYYEGFVEYVATHRKKDVKQIDAVAQGRVWFGFKAVENGLVDQLGGYETALGEAAKLAGISEYETWNVTEPKGFFEVEPTAFLGIPSVMENIEPLQEMRRWASLTESNPFLFFAPLEME